VLAVASTSGSPVTVVNVKLIGACVGSGKHKWIASYCGYCEVNRSVCWQWQAQVDRQLLWLL
jgi:hypothetical protein